MSPEKKARVILIEDHTMVRQLFAHLIREDLGLALAADCTNVAEGTEALLREKTRSRHRGLDAARRPRLRPGAQRRPQAAAHALAFCFFQ
ncbi:MAG: hypothetical protein WDM96_15000 [Lacunisphaera sp.]